MRPPWDSTNFNQQPHDMARRVKLAALLALGASELAQKIFIHATENVLGTAFAVAKSNRADEINEFAEPVFVERGAGVFLGQHAFERGIVFFHRDHRVVEVFADGGLLGASLQI